MIRALTGIQIGPRQFELPPNIPVSDSAGKYGDTVFLAAGLDHVRVVGMVSRQASECHRG